MRNDGRATVESICKKGFSLVGQGLVAMEPLREY